MGVFTLVSNGIGWIQDNWIGLMATLAALNVLAQAIARFTPNVGDDAFLVKVEQFLKKLSSLGFRPAQKTINEENEQKVIEKIKNNEVKLAEAGIAVVAVPAEAVPPANPVVEKLISEVVQPLVETVSNVVPEVADPPEVDSEQPPGKLPESFQPGLVGMSEEIIIPVAPPIGKVKE